MPVVPPVVVSEDEGGVLHPLWGIASSMWNQYSRRKFIQALDKDSREIINRA